MSCTSSEVEFLEDDEDIVDPFRLPARPSFEDEKKRDMVKENQGGRDWR